MPDRVPSDHPTVTTAEATVERAGRTGRPRIAVPADDAVAALDVDPGTVVRIVLDGSRRFGRFERPVSGAGLVLPGVYDTPAGARDPGGGGGSGGEDGSGGEGEDGGDGAGGSDGDGGSIEPENRLPAWCEAAGLSPGRTVHVDVVEPGFLYGLRAPGERAVYGTVGSPDADLSAIAESVTDDEG